MTNIVRKEIKKEKVTFKEVDFAIAVGLSIPLFIINCGLVFNNLDASILPEEHKFLVVLSVSAVFLLTYGLSCLIVYSYKCITAESYVEIEQ